MENPDALLAKDLFACLVAFLLCGVAVDRAIDLDGEHVFVAVEVEDEVIHGVLAPKFEALELAAAQR